MKCAPRGMRKATLVNNKKVKIIDKTSSNSRARADEMRAARDAKSDSCQYKKAKIIDIKNRASKF
jgi:hypothetical protein